MTTPTREALTRDRVLTVALDYVDRHGLDALSMHKLGAELGVKAMSLYNHVANKNDVLSGIIDVLWAQATAPPRRPSSWRDVAYSLARSLRAVIGRHPNAAPLLLSARTLPEHSLRFAETYRDALVRAGLREEQAVPFLRTLVSYALGQSLAELCWAQGQPDLADELTRVRWVSGLLPDGVPDDLVRVGLWFCADCKPAEQFESGLRLMINGLDAELKAEV